MDARAILIKYGGYEFMAIKEFNYRLYGRSVECDDWLLLESCVDKNYQTLEDYLNSRYINIYLLQLKEKYKEA